MNIYQIYYNDETKKKLLSGFIPYENKTCSVFFENAVIRTLVEQGKHKESDYFGVVSPKFKEKTELRHKWLGMDNLKTYIKTTDSDVIRTWKFHDSHNVVHFADRAHPGFLDILTKVFKTIGFDPVYGVSQHPIYCNFFIATPEFWEHYTQELMFPFMEVLEKDPAAYGNSRYGILPAHLQKKWNRTTYPYHAFLMERLPSLFLLKHPEYTLSTWK